MSVSANNARDVLRDLLNGSVSQTNIILTVDAPNPNFADSWKEYVVKYPDGVGWHWYYDETDIDVIPASVDQLDPKIIFAEEKCDDTLGLVPS